MQHVTEEVQISPPVVSHVACRLIHLNLLAKATMNLFLVGILLLLVLYNLKFLLGLLYFPREVFDITYKSYYTAIIVYHLNFLGKSFQ